VQLLSDTDAEVRCVAARYLGQLGVHDRTARLKRLAALPANPEEATALRKEREALQRETEASDRVAAVAGKKLIELLDDKEVEVQSSAATALALLHVTAGLERLIERWKVNRFALKQIEQLCGGSAELEALWPYFCADGPRDVSASALANALAGTSNAMAFLKSELRHPDPIHRKVSVEGLTAAFWEKLVMATPEAAALLFSALKDKDRQVRLFALLSMRVLGTSEAVDALLSFAQVM